MNYVVFDEDEGEKDDEDGDLFIKIIINFTNLIDKVPKPLYVVVYSDFTVVASPLFPNWGCKSYKVCRLTRKGQFSIGCNLFDVGSGLGRSGFSETFPMDGFLRLVICARDVFSSSLWWCLVGRFRFPAEANHIVYLVVALHPPIQMMGPTIGMPIPQQWLVLMMREMTYLKKDFQIFNQWSFLVISLTSIQ
ncbi:hypothetical protein TSUD_30880 [Trifolium subterraneum]|uniref:Uncharacterized protein n=1 Tax=Trifolium subterraneum TaxID=3900 RepID=A0A2Z6M051_TRISU|nr:hypothetical protein TSUD_30880 [Trifolium subterraneum]